MTNASAGICLTVAVVASLAVSCSRDGLSTGNHDDAATDGHPDPTNFCLDGGKRYEVGESIKKDCNTCTCTISGMSCTMMLCPPPNGSGGMAGAGGVAGAGGAGGSPTGLGGATVTPDAKPIGCFENGHTYAVGETFKRDCNTCTCTETGAVCTLMGCVVPVDAAPDLPATNDGSQTCSYAGRTYVLGESLNVDCNTCRCTAYGLACTVMACFHDAGADLRPDAVPSCMLSTNLTFGPEGGNSLYSDVNRLTASTFTITRTYSVWTGVDRPTPTTCSPSLPVCNGASDTTTIATINADLANPDVQSLWTLPQTPVPLFGMDPRASDGTVYSIALDDGHKVLVGDQCASAVMSSCRYISAGLVRLTQDLQKLAKTMLADPVCKQL